KELKKAYREIDQLKEKMFLYPNQSILTPYLLKNKKNQQEINRNIEELKLRLLKAIEENNQEIILDLIPSFFSIYQQSDASVEEIKADLIGIYFASIILIESNKDEPF